MSAGVDDESRCNGVAVLGASAMARLVTGQPPTGSGLWHASRAVCLTRPTLADGTFDGSVGSAWDEIGRLAVFEVMEKLLAFDVEVGQPPKPRRQPPGGLGERGHH